MSSNFGPDDQTATAVISKFPMGLPLVGHAVCIATVPHRLLSPIISPPLPSPPRPSLEMHWKERGSARVVSEAVKKAVREGWQNGSERLPSLITAVGVDSWGKGEGLGRRLGLRKRGGTSLPSYAHPAPRAFVSVPSSHHVATTIGGSCLPLQTNRDRAAAQGTKLLKFIMNNDALFAKLGDDKLYVWYNKGSMAFDYIDKYLVQAGVPRPCQNKRQRCWAAVLNAPRTSPQPTAPPTKRYRVCRMQGLTPELRGHKHSARPGDETDRTDACETRCPNAPRRSDSGGCGSPPPPPCAQVCVFAPHHVRRAPYGVPSWYPVIPSNSQRGPMHLAASTHMSGMSGAQHFQNFAFF